MDMPQNETPEAVTSLSNTILGYIADHGWQLLFFLVVANLIYSHFRPIVQKWLDKRRDQQLAAEYKENPERLIAMQESLALSRQRMQEEYDKAALEQAKKQKQLEEEHREEKIKKWQCVQSGGSYSAENKPAEEKQDSSEQQTRPESSETGLRGRNYNPLMGSTSGVSYRPSRRGGSAGG